LPTLEPNLGEVAVDSNEDGDSFVVADHPHFSERAHLGAGLGIQFLRHIDRTRLLLHLVDISQGNERDPVDDFHTIQNELAQHSKDLPLKPHIVAATKMDAADPEKVRKLEQWCRQNRIEVIKISSVTGEGLEELKRTIFRRLSSQS